VWLAGPENDSVVNLSSTSLKVSTRGRARAILFGRISVGIMVLELDLVSQIVQAFSCFRLGLMVLQTLLKKLRKVVVVLEEVVGHL